ncbi:hypothetical protein NM208_g7714 [Fusarium decemcellulare]|uniref:Uncharacterized protein n=2 Tax=Fusarium decemcellulare TaxID=57161 RepID=A0ACC1S7Z3_9HYPO|nr:hypothetical protein NM208_g9093 [Fusarium decemcellulare]KAJ3534044.1 hypothetical protein NM208_g7714 [Fusarium decemcellulare]
MGVVLFALAVAATAWLIRAKLFWSPKLNMPYLRFDGDDSPAKYLSETTSLMDKGYSQYLKKGIPFSMRNPADPKRPQVILPMKYLAEVRNAPQNQLSFPLFSAQAFLLGPIHGPQQTDEAAHMTRVDLSRALNGLLPSMNNECIEGMKKAVPPCQDWTPIPPYHFIVYLVARISSLVLVGAELCGDDEWIGQSVQTTINVMAASQSVRAKYHPWTRWLARYFDEPTKVVIKNRRRAIELFGPILDARKAAMGSHPRGEKSKYNDGVQWLLEEYRGQGKVLTAEKLAQDELFLTIASTHSTSVTLLSTLFDLMDHPESLEEIRDEVSRMEGVDRQALNELRLLDSFMKESQRLHSLSLVTMQRTSVSGFTFRDGLHIPANTQLAFPNQHLNWDDDVHDEAKTFDAKRWVRKREQIDPTKFHFGSVSEDSINFGNGFHACPGRFLAQQILKLILINLVQNYEFKWEGKDGARPPVFANEFALTPNPTVPILIRERKQ